MAPRIVVLDLESDHELARDLAAGGVFVPDSVDIGDECTLVLRNGDALLRIPALCVYAAAAGSGLQLIGYDADMKQRIIALAAGTPGGAHMLDDASTIMLLRQAANDSGSLDIETILQHRRAGDDSGGLDVETILQARKHAAQHADDSVVPLSPDADTILSLRRPGDGDDLDPSTEELDEPDGPVTEQLSALELTDLARPDHDGEATDGEATVDEPGDDADPERKIALNVHERLRGLTLVQQIKVAQKGEVSERIVLERMYSKNVWEPLLRNPRITGPEVARIARMGALPRPLVELIVGNGGWLQIPEVRRALLGNPRLGTDQILRVLRLLPKHELKLAGLQTAYPAAVRDAAKRLLREMGG